MKKSYRVALIISLCLLVFVAMGCSRKADRKSDAPAQAKKFAKAKGISKPFKGSQAPKPASPQKNLMAGFWQSTKDLEKYDTSEASCRDFCKAWCPMAVQCKISILKKPAACSKLCFTPCTKGLMPKSLGECLLKADKCPQVAKCFTALRDEAKTRAAKKNALGAPPTSPEAPAPTGQPPAGSTP